MGPVPVARRPDLVRFGDRRFYRRKCDAVKRLETFSAELRGETGLDRLGSELVAVVRETVQPAHVSRWELMGKRCGRCVRE